MIYESMIYDRTSLDVEKAKEIRKNKIQKFLTLTDEDEQMLERGCMSVNTLNRIESAIEALKNQLNSMGYYDIAVICKEWDNDDIFVSDDVLRILENIQKIKTAFFTYKETPAIPGTMNSYMHLNAMEKILYDFDSIVKEIFDNYRECGSFECGEVN